jgi:ribosomal protein S6-L-glutamate ligase RimK-like protein
MSAATVKYPTSAASDVQSNTAALAFFFEHPQWFNPIFAELDRRGLAYLKIHAPEHFYAAGEADSKLRVLFNRMSPSADRRQHGSAIFHTLAWLGQLELQGVRVINGTTAFRYEVSKALQLSLLSSLGIPYPKSRVIHDPRHAVAAAKGLRYPVVVKPNVGGSGAGIVRFDSPEALQAAIDAGSLQLGFDHIGLVQEFIPARGGHITRVETLGGKYLYAINVYLTGETFDLCPADICQTASGESLANACVIEGAKAGLRVEGYTPPAEIIEAVERIVAAAKIDVGGIEYVIDDRDGQIYYYDVNALSNFVADAQRVIGFNPFVNLADYLETEVSLAGR